MAGGDDRASPITTELSPRRRPGDVDLFVDGRAVSQSGEAVRKIAGAAEGDVVCNIDIHARNDALASRTGRCHGEPGHEFFEQLHDSYSIASVVPIFGPRIAAQ